MVRTPSLCSANRSGDGQGALFPVGWLPARLQQTGKSFAYLLPAVLWADAHQGQGPVVVSTRTIALQEQLEHKDLPFLHAVLPFEWSSVTAIGRNNYVCLRRMHLADREQHLLSCARSRGPASTCCESTATEGPPPCRPAETDFLVRQRGLPVIGASSAPPPGVASPLATQPSPCFTL